MTEIVLKKAREFKRVLVIVFTPGRFWHIKERDWLGFIACSVPILLLAITFLYSIIVGGFLQFHNQIYQALKSFDTFIGTQEFFGAWVMSYNLVAILFAGDSILNHQLDLIASKLKREREDIERQAKRQRDWERGI